MVVCKWTDFDRIDWDSFFRKFKMKAAHGQSNIINGKMTPWQIFSSFQNVNLRAFLIPKKIEIFHYFINPIKSCIIMVEVFDHFSKQSSCSIRIMPTSIDIKLLGELLGKCLQYTFNDMECQRKWRKTYSWFQNRKWKVYFSQSTTLTIPYQYF